MMGEFYLLKRAKRQRWYFLIMGIVIGCLVTNFQLKRPLNDLNAKVVNLQKQADSLDKLMEDKKWAAKNQDTLIAREKFNKYNHLLKTCAEPVKK